MSIVPVVMSGGVGSRLWPLSRELYPKQLLPLVNADTTLLQDTLARVKTLATVPPIVICNQEHRFLVADQAQKYEVTPDRIILEPVGKNTAPAIAVAAHELLKNGDDPLMLVLAADHCITNVELFIESVSNGVTAAKSGKLVTFGITPTHAETGYGYIKQGVLNNDGSYAVERFVEKPNLDTAEEYLASGLYSWNSGMFLIKASVYLNELQKHSKAIYDHSLAALNHAERIYGYIHLSKEHFSSCPEDSIDYAVMEKTESAVVVPMDAGWSDVGSWSALWDMGNKDSEQNVVKGDVMTLDSKRNFVWGEKKLVTLLGVDDLLVIDTKDALLVANKNRSQDVKKIVNQLKSEGREEHIIHRRVFRPWGTYETIDEDDRFKVKRIVVNPGAQLSLQKHHHRAEHWVVVKGTAKVYRGKEEFLLTENESTYIPLGEVHRLENPGKIPLEMVEVQSGAYLGEDDIVRFSDQYGRSDKKEGKS